jgi:hypothetical protein
MFYTIASRLPLIGGDKTTKNFLKVFIVGSALYVYTHYYLYSAERIALLEKIKPYLYYVLVLDLVITYFLMKWNSPSEEDEFDISKNDNNEQSNSRRIESREQLNNDLQELKRMAQMETYKKQLLEDQQREQYNLNKEDTVSKQSPFMTRDEINDNEKSVSSNNTDKKNKQVSKKVTESSSSSTSSVSSTTSIPIAATNTKGKGKSKSKEKTKVVTKKTTNDDNANDTDVNLPIFMGN